MLALLGAGLLAAGSGWLTWQGGEAWEEVHETLANGLLLLAGLHVAAVLVTGWLSKDRLIPAMLTGRKAVPAGTPPTRPMHRGIAVALLAPNRRLDALAELDEQLDSPHPVFV